MLMVGPAAGVTALVATDAAEATPEAPVAVVVNVYEVPLVRPVTSHCRGDTDANTVQVSEPGLDVAVYDTGVVPPEGAVKVTVA